LNRKKGNRPAVGLVLSGGAARGISHVGVLSVLDDYNVPIDLIVGASYGSIVAAYYAYGYTIEEMLERAGGFRLWSIRDFRPPWTNFFSSEKEESIFKQELGDTKIEDLRIPLIMLAADLEREEPVLFEKGKLSTAIRASSAFPGLFDPLRLGDRTLVDGGIVDSISVRTARDRGADIVISCDVSMLSRIYKRRTTLALMKWLVGRAAKKDAIEHKDSMRSLLRSTLKIIKKYRDSGTDAPDFLIEPLSGEIKPLRFRKVEDGYRLGREAALRVIDHVVRSVCGNTDHKR
jgi:NTE family protein